MFTRALQTFHKELSHYLPRSFVKGNTLKHLFRNQTKDFFQQPIHKRNSFKKPKWLLSSFGGSLGFYFFWNKLGIKTTKEAFTHTRQNSEIIIAEKGPKFHPLKCYVNQVSLQLKAESILRKGDLDHLIHLIEKILRSEPMEEGHVLQEVLEILSNFPPILREVFKALIEKGSMEKLFQWQMQSSLISQNATVLQELLSFPEGIHFLKKQILFYQHIHQGLPTHFTEALCLNLSRIPNKSHLVKALFPLEFFSRSLNSAAPIYPRDVFLAEILAWAYPSPPHPRDPAAAYAPFMFLAAKLQDHGFSHLAAKILWAAWMEQLPQAFKQTIAVEEIHSLLEVLPEREIYDIKKRILSFLLEGEHFDDHCHAKICALLELSHSYELGSLSEALLEEAFISIFLHAEFAENKRQKINFIFFLFGLDPSELLKNKKNLEIFRKAFLCEVKDEFDLLKRVKILVEIYKNEEHHLKNLAPTIQRQYKKGYSAFLVHFSTYFTEKEIKNALAAFQ